MNSTWRSYVILWYDERNKQLTKNEIPRNRRIRQTMFASLLNNSLYYALFLFINCCDNNILIFQVTEDPAETFLSTIKFPYGVLEIYLLYNIKPNSHILSPWSHTITTPISRSNICRSCKHFFHSGNYPQPLASQLATRSLRHGGCQTVVFGKQLTWTRVMYGDTDERPVVHFMNLLRKSVLHYSTHPCQLLD